MNGILFVGGATIIFTSIVNLISGLSNQRIVSSALFVINLMLLFIFKVDILPLDTFDSFFYEIDCGFWCKMVLTALGQPLTACITNCCMCLCEHIKYRFQRIWFALAHLLKVIVTRYRSVLARHGPYPQTLAASEQATVRWTMK